MPRFVHSSKLIEALRGLDIGKTDTIQRVIIDIKVDSFPVIHVQHAGGGALLQLAEALSGGPQVQWVDDGRRREAGEDDDRPCTLFVLGRVPHTIADHAGSAHDCPMARTGDA